MNIQINKMPASRQSLSAQLNPALGISGCNPCPRSHSTLPHAALNFSCEILISRILFSKSLLWTHVVAAFSKLCNPAKPHPQCGSAVGPFPSPGLRAALSSQLFSLSVTLRITPNPSVTGPKCPQMTGTGLEPVDPPPSAAWVPLGATPMEVRKPKV